MTTSRFLAVLALFSTYTACGGPDTFEGELDGGVPGPDLFLRSDDPSFGQALVAADLDGDGEVDFAISAVGTTYVFLGPFTEDRTDNDADYVLFGDNVMSGDVDEDGIPELFTTSYPDPWNPVLHVYGTPFPDAPVLAGNLANVTLLNNSMGQPQVSVGDIHDSPGLELVVGRSGYDGYGPDEGSKLQLFRANRLDGELSSTDAVEVIDATFSAEAFSHVDLADYTGDGRPDMLVSFHGFNHSNNSYVIASPVQNIVDVELEDQAAIVFGVRFARFLGDVDGDGTTDVGGPYFEGAKVWTGPVEGPDAGDASVSLVDGLEMPGRVNLGPGGDFDGDGFGDILLFDPIGPKSFVFFGPLDTASTREVQLAPASAEVIGFNTGVPVPDLDGDGWGEVLLGVGGTQAGDEVGLVWLRGLP